MSYLIKPVPQPLHVIMMVSNTPRYSRRYKLAKDFEGYAARTPGVELWLVEVAFGERPYELTEAGNSHHIQLRTNTELWHKEPAQNVALGRLPESAKYVAFVDADVTFSRHDWAQETIQQLQHYAVVQMWSNAHDLSPDGEVFGTYNSFASEYVKGLSSGNTEVITKIGGSNGYYGKGTPGRYWHPGYAWAWRKDALSKAGRLIDFAILGAADHHMACALIGQSDKSIPSGLHSNYLRRLDNWQSQVEEELKRNVGFVSGTVLHHWHGKKVDRKYWSRWKTLIAHQYNPETDVQYDSQGLLTLTDKNFRLRDGIRAYLKGRNEDSIDM